MGYADGYYYGQGRIICDTSTFSVGDTIRVRSMTDSSKVWNQQVATVGTALVFTVPCYDYYKICTVQTINDTPTEIGGVYKTVDYGQTLFINVLDKTTLGGIQGILNAHQEGTLLAIGDEVDITVNGSPWTMQVGRIDTTNHAVDYVSKYTYGSQGQWGTGASEYTYDKCTLRRKLQGFYTPIAQEDKVYIKQVTRYAHDVLNSGDTYTQYDDYIWTPTRMEVFGVSMPNMPNVQSQMPIFTTQAGRTKTNGSTAQNWWLSDGATISVDRQAYYSSTQGASQTVGVTNTGVAYLPCFTLIADS